MPLPPLATNERRLARFAAAFCWLTLAAGLFIALAPRLLLRAMHLGGYAPASLGERLCAALAGAGLVGLAMSLRRTAKSPREERRSFAPVLWTLAAGAIFVGIAWRRGQVLGISAAPLGWAALVCLSLYVLLATVYIRAAPGVNLGPSTAPAPETAAAKPVALGVRAQPAPLPAAAAALAAPAPAADVPAALSPEAPAPATASRG